MKYLPLSEFDDVTEALNFETPDCRVVGGCDAYTTKAAGADKKLYKNIESSLESQYASLLSFSAGLPPSQASAAGSALNLARSSPFGSLNQVSSRRTFAYLIATLNASHPDYDFSHLLRPSDFKRERNVKKVINTIDTTLYNLRPRADGGASSTSTDLLSNITNSTLAGLNRPATPNGSEKWSPRMWRLIDRHMSLSECNIYSYMPDDDPFEESALWSLNFFFFNKTLKRVCYVYLRGLSRVGNETPSGAKTPNSAITIRAKRPASGTWSVEEGEMESASKRAKFWLGDRADAAILVQSDSEEDEVATDAKSLSEKLKAAQTETEENEKEGQGFEALSDTASETPSLSRDASHTRTGTGRLFSSSPEDDRSNPIPPSTKPGTASSKAIPAASANAHAQAQAQAQEDDGSKQNDGLDLQQQQQQQPNPAETTKGKSALEVTRARRRGVKA